MNKTIQQQLKLYLDSLESNGEITSFVMRRIRLESTFAHKEKQYLIWVINFGLVIAMINIVILIRQLPLDFVFRCLNTLMQYYTPGYGISLTMTMLFIFALIAAGITYTNINKAGGND